MKHDDQRSLLCLTCDLKVCNERALGCQFRLFTNPNQEQRRKAVADKKREAKRANETARTRYWRNWKRARKAESIMREAV